MSANFAPGLQPWLPGGGRQPQVSLQAQWSCLGPKPGGALRNMPHSEAHSTSHTGGRCAQAPFSLTGSGLHFLMLSHPLLTLLGLHSDPQPKPAKMASWPHSLSAGPAPGIRADRHLPET